MKLGQVQEQEDLFYEYCGSGPFEGGPYEMKAAPIELDDGTTKWIYAEGSPTGTVFGITDEDPFNERRIWMLDNVLACGEDLEDEDLDFLDYDDETMKNVRFGGLSPRDFPGRSTDEDGTNPLELFDLAPAEYADVIQAFYDAIGLDLALYAEEEEEDEEDEECGEGDEDQD